jgi:hypothetical protein
MILPKAGCAASPALAFDLARDCFKARYRTKEEIASAAETLLRFRKTLLFQPGRRIHRPHVFDGPSGFECL